MENDFLFPIKEAEQIVEGFMQCNLPEEEWTHEAHLIVGLYFVSHFADNAMAELRKKLPVFNESIGKSNSDKSGYHETMTWFWLGFINQNLKRDFGRVEWSQECLDELLDSEILTDRNSWRVFYSNDLMLSVEARKNLVFPDKKPISSIF